jgi:hypothetical protein
MVTAPVLHVVFNESAFGCLLGVLGRRDGIIVLVDDLSIGPIDRTDGASRTRWLQEQFGGDAYETIADIDGFWSEVASPENRIVAYVSRRNAREYAGLLEVVRQRGDAPLEIVDVTDLELAAPDGSLEKPLGIAELSPAQVIEHKLLESAAPLSATATLSYTQNWARLRKENASLRIVDHETLVSAPITHFDARVVSFATPEWQSTMRMLGPFYSTAHTEGFHAPHLRFILSRLAALVESGQLEGNGDISRLDGHQSSRVRRPR